jgi:ABC-type sugar transport system permease subunit
LILFATFSAWPIVKSLILSFYATNGPKSAVFVGLANFQFLLSDPDFHTAVWNTAVFALCSVFLQLPLSLGLALLLSQKWLKGREFFRLAFFSPHLLGAVFVGVLFQVLFIPQYGLLSKALHALFGIPLDTKWLANPSLVMPALVLTSLWMYVGFNMIYFLAALQAVDRELYEAATVDGANAWQQFWNVTVPMSTPVILFNMLIGFINAFNEFTSAWLITNGGPAGSTQFYSLYLYRQAFQYLRMGKASALAWILFLVIVVYSVILFRSSARWVYYGGER